MQADFTAMLATVTMSHHFLVLRNGISSIATLDSAVLNLPTEVLLAPEEDRTQGHMIRGNSTLKINKQEASITLPWTQVRVGHFYNHKSVFSSKMLLSTLEKNTAIQTRTTTIILNISTMTMSSTISTLKSIRMKTTRDILTRTLTSGRTSVRSMSQSSIKNMVSIKSGRARRERALKI